MPRKQSYPSSAMLNRCFIFSLAVFIASFSGATTLTFEKHEGGGEHLRNWAYEVGVAVITPNRIKDFLGAGKSIRRSQGDVGGEIYSFTVSRRLGQLVSNVGGYTFTPQLELPFTLEVVDEHSRELFVALACSFNVRWVDFPWNAYVQTSFAMGLGLNVSSEIYMIDQERHPGEHRAHLKFNWPIQATFAFPRYPDDQLVLYIIHHSGGRIFDHGGLNAVGIGYRRDF